MKPHSLRNLGFAVFVFLASHNFARAGSYDQCIYALNPTAPAAFSLSNSVKVDASSCGIVVNSSSSTALRVSDSVQLNAKYIDVVGGASITNSAVVTPAPQTQATAQSDPLTFLVPPTSSQCDYTNLSLTGSGSSTLNPGTYCNGITISGSGSVTFNAGTYILKGGGFKVSQSPTLSGAGVTFFLTQGGAYNYGPLSAGDSAVMNLSAPTSVSSPYYGILFYQDRSIAAGSAASTVNTSTTSTLQGVFYFPTTGLTYSGSSHLSNDLMIVADTVTLTQSVIINDSLPNSRSPLEPPVSVSVLPTSAVAYPSQTLQFTATVGNSSQGVTWTLNPTGQGTISAAGLYTAPSSITTQQTITVTATSQEDATKSASATLTLSPPISVLVLPSTATLYGGGTQQFTAAVANTSNAAVLWAVSPTGVGTLSANGLYTAPTSIGAQQTLTITATSQVDTTKSASATVTLLPPVAVSLAPSTATTYAGSTLQLTPTVINATNTAVTWSVNPAGVGTISATGLYTPPASIPNQQTVTVTATSQADTTKSTSATVTLIPLSLTVTPPTATVFVAQTQQFTSTITSSTNVGVNWALNPPSIGIITSAGLYTGPTSVASQQTVTVTATSQSDPTKSASATVTLPPVTITVSPATPTVYAGETQQFTTSVTNTNNTGLTWSISPTGVGTISANGLYTPPASIPSQRTVTVTATSQADTTRSASTTITLIPLSVTVAPTSASLAAGQTQQFTSTLTNSSNTAVTWTSSPSGVGTITAAGLYTAPATITTQQAVTVTATSQVDSTKSASATVNLQSVVIISVSPQTVTLTASQTQQFTASVTNGGNTSVTWSLTPATGFGTITTAGLYTAPNCITGQETVTVTAASVADPTKTISATVTLASSNPFAYQRAIVIDHTQVPNTDQPNFPVLIKVADAALASTASGGHVANPNGYDLVFTSDTTCLNKLNYEVESWTSATGKLIAWVQVPLLSHTADTAIQLCYGNSSISTNQSNATATWDSNYKQVLHLDETSGTSVLDSTTNANNGSKVSASSPSATSAGQIGGAQSFNGTSDFITLPPPMTTGLSTFTVGFWTNTTDNGSNGTYWNRPQFVGDSTPGASSGDFGMVTNSGNLGMWSGLNGSGDNAFLTTKAVSNNQWHYVVAVNTGSLIRLYLDGQDTGQTLTSGLAIDNFGWYLGAQHFYAGGAAFFHQGIIDEFHFSNSARSADWIATEYNNQKSLATFYTFYPENTATVSVSPATSFLYGSQTQQFAASVIGACSAPLSWSVTPAGVGSVSATGLYTAPPSITAEQTVTIAAVDSISSAITGAATITLAPSISVSVGPQSTTLTASQSQQFTATVVNAINTAVTWTIMPAGTGTVNAAGLYTAPASIPTPQTVTVTATSVVDPTKTFVATVTLTNASGFTYHRPIVINHTKVPNTDQNNFAVLISGTYSYLANVANGGKVQNTNGYDIIFTSDCNGVNKLNHQVESYNPSTGQFVAWVSIPAVSHTSDAVFYMSYGSSNFNSTPENPTAVWDANYQAVWHLNGGVTLSAADSTVNGWNGSIIGGATSTTGQVGGAANFSGAGQYIDIGNMGPMPTQGTISLWLNAPARASSPNAFTTGQLNTNCGNDAIRFEMHNNGFLGAYTGSNTSDCTFNYTTSTFTSAFIPFTWNYVTISWNRSLNTESLYYNGQLANIVSTGYWPDIFADVKLGLGGTVTGFWNGQVDEVRMSTLARSADWIATEYNNQNSPSTFYTIFPENAGAISVTPSGTALYASQTQQLSATVVGSCSSPAVTWSLSPAGAGTINTSGLYAAPASIASLETVTITATSQTGPAVSGSTTITLLPPATVGVSPSTATLYSGETAQFTASVSDAVNTAITWSISPAGAGTISSTGLYTAPATINVQQIIAIIATSQADPTKSASATLTLAPGQGVEVSGGQFGYVLNLIAEALCRRPHVPPVVNAGPDQYTGLTCPASGPCSATATVSGAATNYSLEPGQALTYAWSLATGPGNVQFASPNSASTQTTFTAAGTYALQLSVNDGVSTSFGLTHVIVSPAGTSGGSLYLTPTASGPNATNSVVSLQIKFVGFFFGVYNFQNAQVQITVTGANPFTSTVTTDTNGVATFTYFGHNPGADIVTATSTVCCYNTYTSNSVPVTWVATSARLTSSPVTGQFFTADGSGTFNTPATQQPVFTQTFPAIDFNPAAGVITGNTSGVTNLTRPFIDIVTGPSGNFLGSIAAQSNNFQAGVGTLYNFAAVFTGSLNVPAAGAVTFTFTSDDAFVFGIGNGATRVSGPQSGTPNITPFKNYAVMGGVNQRSAAASNSLTVNFPAAGVYPYEVDYAKGGDKNLTLVLTSGGLPIPGAILLTLTPNSVPSTTAGQIQSFVVAATDVNGVALASLPVTLNVSGANQQTQSLTTDGTGQVAFAYAGSPLLTGSDQVQATATVNGALAYSNLVTVPWNTGTNQAPVVSAGSPQTISLPSQAILIGTASDDGLPNNTLTITWSMVSGPGAVTFDDPAQAATAANFSVAGTYVLQLSASDSVLTTNSTVTITVNANTSPTSGWIVNPVDQSTVNGQVPVTLISGITLTSGTLTYYPAANPASVVTISSNTSGSGQIGVFDATLLNNGGYFMLLTATNSQGQTLTSQAYVTVAGDYKPGRVTATITDLTVPAPGLPIQIQRTYDSLVRGTSSDFGYGWRLGINIQTQVSPTGDVTLTLNGRSRTFYFTPPPNGVFTYYYTPQYTAEPGLYGSLVNTGDNCSGVLIHVGNIWECAINNAGQVYQASGYRYTDPYGRVYALASDGTLQSVQDLNGNTLTITPAGITSTNGLNVPFVRDSSGRITKITDTLGNQYLYAYDANSNLTSVTYPSITTPDQYQYDTTHLLTQERDQRGNIAGSTAYYPNGKLKSVTDAVGNMTQYAYNTATNTTTVTNPDGAVVTTVADAYGMPLSVTDPLGRTTTNTYDANHNLLTSTDPLGKTTTYTYDANGFKTSQKDPLGNLSTAVNNQFGGPTSLTDPLNQTQNFTYDANFNPSSITDSLSQVIALTYNPQALPLTLKDANGNTSSYSYDQFGNRTGSTDALNRTTTAAYDTLGRLTSQTDPRGNVTQYAYDALGRKISMTDANGKVTTYAYDANSNKISETDPLNRTTSYLYDAANRQTQTTFADNTTKSYTYDFRGNKLTETDQLGRVTKYVYDLAGQLTSVTKAFGTADAAITSYTYDLDGRQLTETDPRGNTTTYTYDAAGRMTSVRDGAGNLTQYGYDLKGQRTSMIDAKNRTTTYSYDVRGRQLFSTFPDGKMIAKTYDGVGSVLTVTDEENRTTSYAYDATRQLIKATDALNQITQHAYDLSGNKISQTDANNQTTTYVYDELNRRTSRTLPAGQTENMAYDTVGNKISYIDFNGKTTGYSYDALNRLLSRTPDASLSAAPITFNYTPAGKRATMTDPTGSTIYTYSNRDQVLTKATPQGTLTYTYDLFGNVASVVSSNASGTNVQYAWDADNRLASVTDNLTTGVTNYTYDQTSQLASMQNPNGVTHAFTYDNLDRTTNLSVNGPGGVLASYSQTFGFSGHKLSVSESTGRSEHYSYDSIYRLLTENIAGDPTPTNNGALTYSLDPVGNRLSLMSTLAPLTNQSSTYDADDRLSVDTYDSNGNTLTSTGNTFAYDFEDRLTQFNTAVQLAYDGDGNRVGRTESGSTTRYLVDDLTPTGYAQVAEEVVNGAVVAQYTYGRMRISQNRAGLVSYYGYDAGGSVRKLLNSAGSVTDTYAYDAFGNMVAKTGTTINSFLYRGEQFDSTLGVYYLRARYYRPQVGRFLTADRYDGDETGACDCSNRSVGIPSNGAHHLYAYASDDPTNLIDPSGRGSILEWTVKLQTIAFRIALHPATHPFLIGARILYCIHIMLVIWEPGGDRLFRDQWPLWPLCWPTSQ